MTKVISLSDEAYKRLYDLKKGKESFSDVVLKITEKEVKKPLSDYAGCWKGSKEELDRIAKVLREEREETRFRDVDL
jgi:predicted CopG family antitoxin